MAKSGTTQGQGHKGLARATDTGRFSLKEEVRAAARSYFAPVRSAVREIARAGNAGAAKKAR